MFEVFAAVDWYDTLTGRVAVIPRPTPDYDPASLVGQLVTINGVSYLVRDTVWDTPLALGLLVEQPGLPDAG